MIKKRINTKAIVSTGILLAVEIILQLIGNNINTSINPNLALIPITIGAIMYGPIVGGFLGLVNGAIILAAPSTTIFFNISKLATVATCLTKGLFAGLLGGLLYLPFKKKYQFGGSILISILVPIINTLTYSLFWYLFFKGKEAFAGQTTYLALWSANQFIILINFVVEFALNVIVVPMLMKVFIIMYKDKVIY